VVLTTYPIESEREHNQITISELVGGFDKNYVAMRKLENMRYI